MFLCTPLEDFELMQDESLCEIDLGGYIALYSANNAIPRTTARLLAHACCDLLLSPGVSREIIAISLHAAMSE